jgi:hypothetical protein
VQGEVLVSRFGVSAALLPLLRQLWLAHLPVTGILEPDAQLLSTIAGTFPERQR